MTDNTIANDTNKSEERRYNVSQMTDKTIAKIKTNNNTENTEA